MADAQRGGLVAREFLRRYGAQHLRTGLAFAPDALRALNLHAWPGNIRELQNRVHRAVIMAEGKRVTAKDLELTDAHSAFVGRRIGDGGSVRTWVGLSGKASPGMAT